MWGGGAGGEGVFTQLSSWVKVWVKNTSGGQGLIIIYINILTAIKSCKHFLRSLYNCMEPCKLNESVNVKVFGPKTLFYKILRLPFQPGKLERIPILYFMSE